MYNVKIRLDNPTLSPLYIIYFQNKSYLQKLDKNKKILRYDVDVIMKSLYSNNCIYKKEWNITIMKQACPNVGP